MNTFTEPDPAERRAFNRLFYSNRRPTWLGHWVSQFCRPRGARSGRRVCSKRTLPRYGLGQLSEETVTLDCSGAGNLNEGTPSVDECALLIQAQCCLTISRVG